MASTAIPKSTESKTQVESTNKIENKGSNKNECDEDKNVIRLSFANLDKKDENNIYDIYELTLKQASLSKFLSKLPNHYDFVQECSITYGDAIQNSKLGLEYKIPIGICKIIAYFTIDSHFIKKKKIINSETMQHCLTYLKHHNGLKPEEIPFPFRSVYMPQLVNDPWDAEFVDMMNKKAIFDIIDIAITLEIDGLLHLGCAKIATLVKQLDEKDINRMIENADKDGDYNDKDAISDKIISKYSDQTKLKGSVLKPK